MKRLFYAGPKGHKWMGRCEWDSETGSYVHYNEWPLTRIAAERDLSPVELQLLIDGHLWVEEAHDPALQLPEGM